MNSTYSFLEVQATLVGPGGYVSLGQGSGSAEEGISIDAIGEIDTMQVGADGTGMHSLHADKSGKIVVRLLKTSQTNAILSGLYALQTSSGALHGQNTLTITDSSRNDVITCRQVAFAKAPPLNYGKDGGLVEWEFNAIAIDRTLGA